MRRFMIVLSVAALVAVAGCTPTATPASSTTAPTTTAPVQGLREVWVPMYLPIDSAYYPSNATISAVTFQTWCNALVVFDEGVGFGDLPGFDPEDYEVASPQNCVPEPGGVGAASPPVPLRSGLNEYGHVFVAPYPGSCGSPVVSECTSATRQFVLRIRW
jgi:hypothetical protein